MQFQWVFQNVKRQGGRAIGHNFSVAWTFIVSPVQNFSVVWTFTVNQRKAHNWA